MLIFSKVTLSFCFISLMWMCFYIHVCMHHKNVKPNGYRAFTNHHNNYVRMLLKLVYQKYIFCCPFNCRIVFWIHFVQFKFCIILKFTHVCTVRPSFRCIAVCSLGLWVCEELMQKNIHHQVKDAINVLGVTLKVSDPRRQGSFTASYMDLRFLPANLYVQYDL